MTMTHENKYGGFACETFESLLGEMLYSDGEESDVEDEVTPQRRGSDDGMYLAGNTFPSPSITRTKGGRLTTRRESNDDDYIVGLHRESSTISNELSFEVHRSSPSSPREGTIPCPEVEVLSVSDNESSLPTIPCLPSQDYCDIFIEIPPVSSIAVFKQAPEQTVPLVMEELDAFASASTLPACIMDVADMGAVNEQVPCQTADEVLCVVESVPTTPTSRGNLCDALDAVYPHVSELNEFSLNSCVVMRIPTLSSFPAAVSEQASGECTVSMMSLPVDTLDISFQPTGTFDSTSTLPIVMIDFDRESQDDIDILSCNASDIITSPTALKTQFDYERFGSMILANGWVDDTDGEDSTMTVEDTMYELPISEFDDERPTRSREGAFYRKSGFNLPIEIPMSPIQCHRPIELPFSPCVSPALVPTMLELPNTQCMKLTKESLALNEVLSEERQWTQNTFKITEGWTGFDDCHSMIAVLHQEPLTFRMTPTSFRVMHPT
eukprot:TRINITY_DN1722_c0_g1_i1.p1 TRINITY_DN1722_c0_g1~~TRINITY_DN1722_c0_g1_i1.p1  ORF type:complete len:495 (+),score=90.12 TRINITY_DN1722_c0_g1_i1:80-1564(+)